MTKARRLMTAAAMLFLLAGQALAQYPDPRIPYTWWYKVKLYFTTGELDYTIDDLVLKGDLDVRDRLTIVEDSDSLKFDAHQFKYVMAWELENTQVYGVDTLGNLDQTITTTVAGGDRGINLTITQATNALTGTLDGIYARATGYGTNSSTGRVQGSEIGARLPDADGTKSAGEVVGSYSWADAKIGTVGKLRVFEASLDGGAGSTATTAVAFEAFNNSSGTQTTSIAYDVNEGSPSGRKAYTYDHRLQNGATFDNAVNNTFEWNENSDELIWTFGSNTVTVSSGDVTAFNFGGGISTTWAGSTSGGIKIAPIATGTALTTIQNQNVSAATITLPSATSTLPGLGLTNVWTGANTINDDLVFAIGTTATNAETQVTIKFDETTSGVGQFRIGDTSNPQVLKVNPGASVFGSIVNINHTLGDGNCTDLLGSYSKINVIGAGDADMTIVGDASRAYVGLTGGSNNSVASQAYGTQAWARHGGTGAITAMSGVSAMMDVGAENFTATTINSGHFHIQGAADVTGQYDGVMVEAYPDVDTMDALLALATDGGADVGAGIRFSGSPACEVLFSSGAKIFTGTAANGDAVYAEVGTKDAIGSLYLNTTNGYIYIQVANAGAAADWYKVTATDAD